jgi:hypothetical protein
MEMAPHQDRFDLATLSAVIARSQIVLAKAEKPPARLPAGFEAVDVAVLEWIAAEGRRAGRSLLRM